MWRLGNSVSELLASCSRLFRGSNEAASPDAHQAGRPQKRPACHGSSSAAASAAAGLGVDLLSHVLACVPPRERLTCCALVCKDWAAAAAAATSSIGALGRYKPESRPLDGYLARHGSHVRELQLSPPKYRRLEVLLASALQPLQGLQLLQLHQIRLQQPDSGRAVDVAAALARSLTYLQLTDCTWSLPNGLRSLAALSNLQHLQLCHVRHEPATAAGIKEDDRQGLDRALAQLTRLTHLTVAADIIRTGPLQKLSCLEQLRELQLPVRGEAHPAANLLPGSLTALSLVASGDHWQLGPGTAPGLAGLTALQRLSLAGPITDPHDEDELLLDELTVTFSADLLAQPSLAQLTHLHVRGGGSEFMPQFLAAVLPSLMQLQHLQLEVVLTEEVPAAAFSSLAALTCLTQLALHEYSCDWPMDAVQRMFGFARRLPALCVLRLSFDQPWPNVVDSDGEELDDSDADSPLGAVQTSDIANIVTCCPGLQELNLTHALTPGCSLKRLTRLTGLTRLRLGGKGVTNRALEEVGQLSSLRCLVLGGRPQCYSFEGLLHLLPLRGLTRLAALCCFGGDEDNIGDAFWEEHDDNTRVFDFSSSEAITASGSRSSSTVVWRKLFSYLVLEAEDEVADEVAAMRQQLSTTERQYALTLGMLAQYEDYDPW